MAEFQYFLGRSAQVKREIGAISDKSWLFENYRDYMYTRLLAMFEYKNLPDDLPHEILEYYLLSNGSCFVTEVEGKIYAFQGTFGGEPDPYYRPQLYVVANPALNLSESYDWKKDGVLMRNDKLWIGLENLITRYAGFMAENALSIRVADIMLRIVALLSAPEDSTRLAGMQYLKDLENGKLSVIGENRFFDGIKLQSPPSNNGSYLTQFIELHQYFKGSFYNEIGLNANFNMKREAIGKGEASLSQDSLLPLCDTMLQCRKEDVSKLNEMYGLNITVEFASAWRQNQIEAQLELKQLQVESSQLEKGEENAAPEGDSGDTSSGVIETEEETDSSGGRSESEGMDETASTDRCSTGEVESETVDDDESALSNENGTEVVEEDESNDDSEVNISIEVDVEVKEDVDDTT